MEVTSHLTEKALRDYKLVQQAIGDGNQHAYAELMKNYRDSLYFMLLKMTNNPHDAEDLTIEAFGKAFKKLHQYTPDYAFSTWLFKIASNNCIDFIRKKKKYTFSIDKNYDDEETGTELANKIPAEVLDPEEDLMKKQRIQLMREVVEKLKPHYRTLIELRYFKEFSYDEIATELNLPLGTVKAQLFRAREFLYQILKNSKDKI
ncbi:MAG TPA: sigma-70 family RNA polymerase sigma factor [Bacteroidales bacterium]|nr:sigma-70 family RNA polymerase sigma factor [Bacteroidales bacterium]HPE58237.1 sigma-70 family RNA polymerase sigma factor [Bacteroidales bacterium]HRX95422.1 sigma-70 family RNA polymerase sigma factor [Bacteroidales bacterium]